MRTCKFPFQARESVQMTGKAVESGLRLCGTPELVN